MGIRSAAKAIITDDGKILLNKDIDVNGQTVYSLPGGGQNEGESLTDAVIRECLEETGYTVRPVRFAALCELICTDETLRTRYPDHAHRVFHIFICEITGHERLAPTEFDAMQVDGEWLEVSSLSGTNLRPRILGESVMRVIAGNPPEFFGTEYDTWSHI